MPRRSPRPAPRHRTEPDPMALAVGVRVRRLRAEQAFTFDAFVEETGLGRGYISELERGLVVPSLHTLARLASALEVTIADLVLGPTTREQIFDVSRGLPEPDLAQNLRVMQALRAAQLPADSEVTETAARPAAPSADRYVAPPPKRPLVTADPAKRSPAKR